MEYPWRPRPPIGNFCPVCSNSHFPFCPPPPPQYFRPPPPPPDQFFGSLVPPPLPPQPLPPQTSYDPFVDHQGGTTVNPYPPPPQAQIPARPWNANPNFGNDYYGSSNPGFDYDNNGQIGVKRMRVDTLADDERRLKLIRDHGAASHGFYRNSGGGYRSSNDSVEPGNFGDKRGNFGDRFQGIESGYRQEINSHAKQNYGEQKMAYHHTENNKNHGYGNIVHVADGYRKFEQAGGSHETVAYNNATYPEQRTNFPMESQKFNNQFWPPHIKHQHMMEPKSAYYGLPNRGENAGLVQDSPGLTGQPPLPTSPPPPLPVEPSRFPYSDSVVSSSASGPSSLFPIALDSAPSFQSPYSMGSEAITSVSTHYSNRSKSNSSGYYPEEIQAVNVASSKTFKGEREEFSPRHPLLDKPKVIDASHILKHPHRASRPDHIVIILRGLPGSGKSYLAKVLRDLEVENDGVAPRIHSMDEYFMTEVEKVEESENSRSLGAGRGKKLVKKVMEYCYEPEMEEAYRSSMLKAFKKTLDEGAFPFVIVDDRNLRVADFAQFWATAKRSGYEVYLLEATYKDPAGCAARNVHGFTQNDIHKMANQWEEAPSLYMKLDVKSLLHGDDLEESGIQEVDMDTEDGNNIDYPSSSEDTNIDKDLRLSEDLAADGLLKDELVRDPAGEHPLDVVKELGESKWSNDLDEDDVHKTEAIRGDSSALSGLIKSYSKKGKSVRWADQIGRIGFSIGTGKTTNVSLFIGPGSGYNQNSNPLPEEERQSQRSGESRRRNIFQEQLRAERESFRAVFDKRRHRIGGLEVDED